MHCETSEGTSTITGLLQTNWSVASDRPSANDEDSFRTLADNIAQLAWMADGCGSIFWFNKRWFDFTGTRLDEVRGWGWRSVHHPDHADRVTQRIRHCFETGEVWEDTFPLRGRDGTYRWFLSRAVPIRDKGGRIWRWVGTNTDVTEQRAAEEALREADRRKDQLLAMLAHELRNPMAPVLNAVYLLKRKAPQDDELRWATDIVERQLKQMARLVEDLLDVSRIGCGKVALRKEVVELSDVVAGAVETTGALLEERRHELSVSLPAGPLRLEADRDRLEQTLVNLLSNAAKYTEPGGKIGLSAEPEGTFVAIRVRDSGIGMSPAFLAHAFEMFRQAEEGGRRSRGGLGIGLSLVRRLVEMHGGSVTAYSAGRGQGSEFTVRLPLLCGATEALPSPQAVDHPVELPSHRILVVDDNVDAARSLGRLLELDGHVVRVVHDGPQALAAFEAETADVVLMDIGLPGMDGYEVAREMRRRAGGEGVTLAALTGFGQEEDHRRSVEAGFDHHLVKPVQYETLRSVIARHVRAVDAAAVAE
jgi:hypothetical protein